MAVQRLNYGALSGAGIIMQVVVWRGVVGASDMSDGDTVVTGVAF